MAFLHDLHPRETIQEDADACGPSSGTVFSYAVWNPVGSFAWFQSRSSFVQRYEALLNKPQDAKRQCPEFLRFIPSYFFRACHFASVWFSRCRFFQRSSCRKGEYCECLCPQVLGLKGDRTVPRNKRVFLVVYIVLWVSNVLARCY